MPMRLRLVLAISLGNCFSHNMKVEHLIQMAEKRIAYLENMKAAAELIGDIDSMIRAESEIVEVQLTLAKLKSIPSN